MVVSQIFRQIHINTFRQHCQVVRLYSKKPPKSEFKADREAYEAFEREWEKNVNYNLLSPLEKEIHLKHKEAIEDLKWTYLDPISGKKASTRFKHYCRNKCCGSACRHCII